MPQTHRAATWRGKEETPASTRRSPVQCIHAQCQLDDQGRWLPGQRLAWQSMQAAGQNDSHELQEQGALLAGIWKFGPKKRRRADDAGHHPERTAAKRLFKHHMRARRLAGKVCDPLSAPGRQARAAIKEKVAETLRDATARAELRAHAARRRLESRRVADKAAGMS